MRADGRFGGHFVQGHADGTGTLEAVRAEGDAHWLTVGFPAPLAPLFVLKGSVAVDGISLTIADLRPGRFRRDDRTVHLATYEPVVAAARRSREPGMRHDWQVRRACHRNLAYVGSGFSRTCLHVGSGFSRTRRHDHQILQAPHCQRGAPPQPLHVHRGGDRSHSAGAHDRGRRRRGSRERGRSDHGCVPDHPSGHQLHGQVRTRADLPVDDRAAARRAGDPAGGVGQHHAVRHRLLRTDRREAQCHHGHLGRRSCRHRAGRHRPGDETIRSGAAGAYLAAAFAGWRCDGARGSDGGGGRSRAHGGAVSGGGHLRNHERGRLDGPRA